MKVAQNNILEFIKIFRDIAEIRFPANSGGGTHFSTSSDRDQTWQAYRSDYGEFKNHLGFSIGVADRWRSTENGIDTGVSLSSDDGENGCSEVVEYTFPRFWDLLNTMVWSFWPESGRKMVNQASSSDPIFRRLLRFLQATVGSDSGTKR